LDATATPVQAGPCRLFVGKRSDPFFADVDGVLHWLIDGATGGYQWTGKDSFVGTNISPSRWRYQMTCSARAGHRGVDHDQVAPRRRARGYPPDEATAAARTLLPDILHYDRTRPAHDPNGRVQTDDVFSACMIFMVHGRAAPQAVGPYDDLMAVFPFLGPPA
jgi:hypothetical protein